MTKHPAHDTKNSNLAAATQALCTRFLEELSRRCPDLEGQQSALLDAATSLLEKQTHLIIDEASHANLRLGALVLVAYRALQGQLARQELLSLLQDAFCGPYRQELLAGVRTALDQTPDPMSLTVQISRDKERYSYGPSFTFEHLQDDHFAYLVGVKRCLWHTFLLSKTHLN